ncbi:MAG TPA: ECF-type sigma factor [Terriglobia bacterium]|nr:ECF-type sigma factor [Terriglobia bacterium]
MRRAIFAHDVTPLLRGWSRGDAQVLNRIVGFADRNVRRIADRCLAREYSIQTVQPTAFINEAHLLLIDVQHVRYREPRGDRRDAT